MIGSDDQTQDDLGIYPKYVVFKHPEFEPVLLEGRAWADPLDDKGITWKKFEDLEKVEDFCFVLKITDKHARIAMAAYAESVKDEKPRLASELQEILQYDGIQGS